MSIAFGNYLFSEPMPAFAWSPPQIPGIYAILVPSLYEAPRPFQVVYFGESSNLSEERKLSSHDKYRDWMNITKSSDEIYVSTLLMRNSTKIQRLEIQTQLKEMYMIT